jgi:hypothetical protein
MFVRISIALSQLTRASARALSQYCFGYGGSEFGLL